MTIVVLATFITGMFASASASQVLNVFVTNFPKTHLGQEPGSLVTLRCQGSPVIARELFCTRSHSDGTTPENFTVPVGSVLVVTDVSWNFRVKKKIKPLQTRAPDAADGTWRMQQPDIDRIQEFRKCIECYLCQDVCHVLREHRKHEEFIGPRFLVHLAALEMHPLDTEDRIAEVRDEFNIGYCNITKCCTKVCPENITITDNAIIPLKERVIDECYDPLTRLWRLIVRKR